MHRLILHADDLGMNRAISDGILRGFREGLLTSTSVLANAPDALRALELWSDLAHDHAATEIPSTAARKQLDDPQKSFDLGVHLNLTQGQPLLADRYPTELLDEAGRFPGVFALFARLWGNSDRYHAAIQAELEEQIKLLLEYGWRPTHLNGHQYIEMIPAVADVLPALLERFQVRVVRVAREPWLLRSTVLRGQFLKWPLARIKRMFAERFQTRMGALNLSHPDVFFGTVYAGGIQLDWLEQFLARLPDADRVEVGLHPGEWPQDELPIEAIDGWHDPLAKLRPRELRMLTSPELPELLELAGWRLGRLA